MRRKLGDVRLQLRARFMGGKWFRRAMLEEEPDFYEDEGGDGKLLNEALGRLNGPVMPRLGTPGTPDDDEEEDLHVV